MDDTTEEAKLFEKKFQEAQQEKRKHKWRYVYGIFSAVLSTIPQLGGVAFIQLMVQMPPDFELSVSRFGAGFLLSIVGLLIMRTSPKVQKESIKWLVGVGVVAITYTVAMYSHYLKRIPIVTLLCIHQSFKLILSLILSRIFLRQAIPLAKAVVCLVTLAGAIFTVIPRVEVYLETENSKKEYNVSMKSNNERAYSNGTNSSEIFQETNFGDANFEERNDVIQSDDVMEFFEALAVISFASLSSIVQNILIYGSPLKDESANVLTFWYFSCGLVILVPATLIFERPFIPDNTKDILLCVGHSVGAHLGNFFDIIANQILEVNTLTVLTTVRLPLAFLAEETFLKDVVPVKRVYLLIIGTIITS